jgi:hypothetical protein
MSHANATASLIIGIALTTAIVSACVGREALRISGASHGAKVVDRLVLLLLALAAITFATRFVLLS